MTDGPSEVFANLLSRSSHFCKELRIDLFRIGPLQKIP